MSRSDDLTRDLGRHMASSITTRRDAASVTPPPPADPRYDGVAKARNVAEIGVDRIAPDPDQPRREFDAEPLEALAESLRSRGQLQPVRVRWDPGQHKYILIVGERRWRAAKLAGLATLTAVVHDGDPGRREVRAMQLVENAKREDLKPVEQARAYRSLMDEFGWSTTVLAREVCVSQPSVVQALRLLDVPEAVRQAVEQGDLSPSAAYEISKVGAPDDQAALAREAVDRGLGTKELRSRVRERKTGARLRADFAVDGNTVTVSGPAASAGPEAVRDVLLKAAARCGG